MESKMSEKEAIILLRNYASKRIHLGNDEESEYKKYCEKECEAIYTLISGYNRLRRQNIEFKKQQYLNKGE